MSMEKYDFLRLEVIIIGGVQVQHRNQPFQTFALNIKCNFSLSKTKGWKLPAHIFIMYL